MIRQRPILAKKALFTKKGTQNFTTTTFIPFYKVLQGSAFKMFS